jgi:Zn-dependent protease
MLTGSLPLGTIQGIPISVHWSTGLISLLIGSGLIGAYGAGWGIAALVVFLASVIAHELGHALTARRYGVRTESIELWALGGMAKLDREAPTARAEGWIAVAGPLTSLVLGIAFLCSAIGLVAAGLNGPGVGMLGWLALINGALAVFNMLPGAPLDGGRVLKAWRWGRHGDRFRASREAAGAGRTLGWSMAAAGIVATFYGYPLLMLAATGAFIAISARNEEMAANVAEQFSGTRVGDVTWYGVADAPAGTDADTMVWQRSRLGSAGVVAVRDAAGRVAGFVDEDRLLAVPDAKRPDTLLTSLMTPIDRVARAHPDEDLSRVLPRLNPLSPFVTVWNGDRLLGVVPKQRLFNRLRAAQVAAR